MSTWNADDDKQALKLYAKYKDGKRPFTKMAAEGWPNVDNRRVSKKLASLFRDGGRLRRVVDGTRPNEFRTPEIRRLEALLIQHPPGTPKTLERLEP